MLQYNNYYIKFSYNFKRGDNIKCPNCNKENIDSAKFCKYCGTPLKDKSLSHSSVVGSNNTSQTNDKPNNNAKIIIIALVVIIVALAGAFAYLAMDHNNSDSQDDTISSSDNNNHNSSDNSNSDDKGTQSSSGSKQSTKASSPSITIKGGSFTTGSADEDHTYAAIDLGSKNAGKRVIVQIWYSRDGNTLNNGNMVPVTVESDGYVHLTSADAYLYYPDHATIKVYDSDENLKDTLDVDLTPTSGTQSF